MRKIPNVQQSFRSLAQLGWRLSLIFMLLGLSTELRAQNTSQSAQILSDDVGKAMANLTSKKTKMNQNQGPLIDHYFSRSGRVEVEKVAYPEPSEGRKVVVIRLPEADSGRIDIDQYQVEVKFTVQRLGDACNKTIYQGSIDEQTLPDPQSAHYFELTYNPKKGATTLRGCTQPDKTVRAVEIVTELKNLRPFKDNLVFYVPNNVDVTADIWKRVNTVQGIAP